MYSITTYGNGEILKGVFDAIAICLNAQSGTLYIPLIRISMIVGGLWAALWLCRAASVIFWTSMSKTSSPRARHFISGPGTPCVQHALKRLASHNGFTVFKASQWSPTVGSANSISSPTQSPCLHRLIVSFFSFLFCPSKEPSLKAPLSTILLILLTEVQLTPLLGLHANEPL